jgi:hypothetical protein
MRVNFIYSFNVLHSSISKEHNRSVYLYNAANFDEISYYLNKANLSDIVINNSHNINFAWSKWKDTVTDIINKYVPKKVLSNRHSPPWIDGDVVHLANKKEVARKRAKKSGKLTDWDKYKELNNRVKNLVNSKHKSYLNHCFDNLNTHPKKFWGLVSHKSKKGSLPEEMFYENKNSTDTETKADMFNQFFFSQFNFSTHVEPDVPVFTNLNLYHITITYMDVINVLQKLDINKAYGPDGLATIIYKNCAHTLAPSLVLLFNLSLDLGILPADWKAANIVPVFKKGVKNDITNYRPISLLPVAIKIMERCIHSYVYNIVKNDIFQNQHGFMARRSTTSQLVEFYNNIYNNCDNKTQSDVIFLDLKKAFDSVPHNLLLLKLHSFGINGKLLDWIRNYLSGRKQRVIINGKTSKYKEVISGVPQGSILGPLMFLLYINDMNKSITDINTSVYLYADDSKLVRKINTILDCMALQNSINELSHWAKTWGLRFNPMKCSIMSFVSGTPHKILYNYNMENVTLSRTGSFVDLGVTVCDNLKWDLHIDNITSKANKRLGLVKRCIGNDCSLQVKLTCYTSLVRPLLESCSCVWACTTKKLLTKIETVQRRASKFITNNYNMDYDLRLSLCNLLPLSLRRDYLDLVFLYNYIHDLVDVNISVAFVTQNRVTRNVDDDLRIVCNRLKHLFCEKLFINRVARTWNKLPYDIRCLELTESGLNTTFKKDLKLWLTKFFHESFNVYDNCSWHIYCGCTLCRLT